MAQMPRWARKQIHEQKLKDVLQNPYADVSDVFAAKKAVEEKLNLEDRQFMQQQLGLQNKYLKRL